MDEKRIFTSLKENMIYLKKQLPASDVLCFSFATKNGVACTIFYVDGIVNKQLLGELVVRPIANLRLENDGGRVALIEETLQFPECKRVENWQDVSQEILDGKAVLFLDATPVAFSLGATILPVRAIVDPPTDVAIKGPREGFIEDVKTNMSLIRKRMRSPDLRFETVRIGKRSQTTVVLCFLDGIANDALKKDIVKKLRKINIDNLPDSSYLSALLAPHPHSIFRSIGTTEKPDVFTAKLVEGRIGLLVDGSPIALTLPYILTEDFQTAEDYFVSPFMATIFRALRFISLIVAIFLPAFYVSAQLFKMQLLPLGLMLTIASSVRELPLSPAMEMFVVLFLLETLKEASIRMPKYVGMSLSVVGALVLGETAVSAGFLSTPAIIIVAFSGICLYTVPDFVETGSILRWLFLVVSGCFGPFGIMLLCSFLLCYLCTLDNFDTPVLTPFSPFIQQDLRDSIAKYDLRSLTTRPRFLHGKNKTRMRLTK